MTNRFEEIEFTHIDGSTSTKLIFVPTIWDWVMRVLVIIATVASVIGAIK